VSINDIRQSGKVGPAVSAKPSAQPSLAGFGSFTNPVAQMLTASKVQPKDQFVKAQPVVAPDVPSPTTSARVAGQVVAAGTFLKAPMVPFNPANITFGHLATGSNAVASSNGDNGKGGSNPDGKNPQHHG
jgi:hypothetical protein